MRLRLPLTRRRGRPGRRGRWGLVVVHGRSMEPTLYDGDRLVVRHGATPRAGQLVVARLPGRGLAVKRATMRQPVGEGTGWWVERDNSAEGVDSWLVGAIADDDVPAVVRARLWPRRRAPLRR